MTKIVLHIEQKSVYLHITCAPGLFTFQGMVPVIDQIKAETEARQCFKILIDFRALQAPEVWEQYQSVSYMAESWGMQICAAGLAPANQINRLGENTAVNRGANFAMFSELAMAVEWLLSA